MEPRKFPRLTRNFQFSTVSISPAPISSNLFLCSNRSLNYSFNSLISFSASLFFATLVVKLLCEFLCFWFQACLDCGFFYVVNHGISQEFMDQVFFESKKFFQLPLDEKMNLLRNEKHRGYTPVLDELLDPDNQLHGSFLIHSQWKRLAVHGYSRLRLYSRVYYLLGLLTFLINLSFFFLVGDYKEGYYIGVEVPEDDPQAEKPFHGQNVWPADCN